MSIVQGTEREAFSTQLRSATSGAHDTAEHSGFMGALLGGELGLAGAAALTRQLLELYTVLEQASDAQSLDPVAGTFVHPELRRLPSLEADLVVLAGEGWRSTLPVLPATQDYVDRLREVAFTWPGGFVAHHYTRYMGDLSGGVIIGRHLASAIGRPDGAGTSFYRFEHIAKPKVFKDGYRSCLDAAPWDDEERLRVVDEVLAAYRHNSTVLSDLGARLPELRAAAADA